MVVSPRFPADRTSLATGATRILPVPPANITVPLDCKSPHDELIRRANSAVRTLKGGERGAFAKAVRAGLLSAGTDNRSIPPQTQTLARLSWPLVLSTNYDNCYAAAFHGCFP